MELISWSLNAIDKVFSSRKVGTGEPTCPDGTFLAGYTMDAWDKWRVVCLAILDIEDVEDVIIYATMIVGMLCLGGGLFQVYRKLRKVGLDFAGSREVLTAIRKTRSDIAEVKDEMALLHAEINKLNKSTKANKDEDFEQ